MPLNMTNVNTRMPTVDPAQPFPFDHVAVTPAESLEAGVDAWEGITYTGVALPILGSDINTGFALDGNQPPGLIIDSGTGVISGVVQPGIFKAFLETLIKERGRGNQTVELGPDEYPSPYDTVSSEIIRKDYVFEVSGTNTDPATPVPVTETWTIRVGKNMSVDLDGFDIAEWLDEEVPIDG